MTKPVYRMSESGGCLKVFVAKGLGYEPIAKKPADKERLNYYTKCEKIVSDIMECQGYEMQEGGICQKCLDEFGEEKYGIHVEIDQPLFRLIGHLDRRIKIDNVWYPCEIKSFGRFMLPKFLDYGFEKYPNYAGQEICYLECEKKPGVYLCLNRDTGELHKFSVPYNGMSLKEFPEIELNLTFQSIVDKINLALTYIDGKELPDIEYSGYNPQCKYCDFKYLCVDEKETKKTKELHIPDLVEAASMYKNGLAMEKEGKQLKSEGTRSLLQHSKLNKVEKFRTGGVSFSYNGTTTKESVDIKTFKERAPEWLIKECIKESKPYDLYSIKILKEK